MRTFLSPEERNLLQDLPPDEAEVVGELMRVLDARLIPLGRLTT